MSTYAYAYRRGVGELEMRELEHAHERLDGLREVVADLLGEGVERVAHHALPHELERSAAHPR